MSEAIRRLRAAGYVIDFSAVAGAKLRCGECGELVAADAVTIDEIVRFEGESNPDDEAILLAITSPCGHRGQLSAAYGTAMTPEEVDVLRALTS